MAVSKPRVLHGQSVLYLVVFLLTVHLMLDSVSGGSWWSLGVTTCGLRNEQVDGNPCPNCAALRRDGILTSSQELHCQAQPAIIPSISRGARHAIVDCQHRFKNSRWNCSTLYGKYLFGKFVSQNYTRETAVLTSYFIAGAIWALATDCHDQMIPSCSCQAYGAARIEDSEGNIIFSTCNANVEWAKRYLDTFVTRAISNVTLSGGAERHNIAVGEEVMAESLRTCRCHGISGTCTVQTCYKRVHQVEEIGHLLFGRYNGADQISNLNQLNTPGSRINNTILVYTDPSPDFCVRNDTKGITGVAHRLCDSNSNNPNACSTICCGRGYYSVDKIVPVEECQFIWCCRIECIIVRNDTITEHRCHPPNRN